MFSESDHSFGPDRLGRGLIVNQGASVPEAFASAERVVIDRATLANPSRAVDVLHRHWLSRLRVVVELQVQPGELRIGETDEREPYELNVDFQFGLERLGFLIWANNYDFRDGSPIWWWSRKAARIFGDRVVDNGSTCTDASGIVGDVTLDAGSVWCDGGPRQFFPDGLVEGARVLHRDAIQDGTGVLDSFSEPRTGLAPDQLAAVRHGCGPARIIAPAGSGKTRVLTERLRHLIRDRNWEPQSILAVAYNKRAAVEMQERTQGLGANIKTLNALGLAIVNGTGGFLGTGNSRRVIGERDVRRIIDSLVDVRHVVNGDRLAPYLDALRDVRIGLASPEDAEVINEADGFASMFGQYIGTLNDQALTDFDGQLYEAIRVLLRNPRARAVAQMQARHMLVDEFQDLAPAHLLLIRLLASPTYDVFGVGDDDQVIYGYSGATPSYLIDFDKHFPGGENYALSVNYRCPPRVVDAASSLLSYNEKRIDKSITAARAGETDVAITELCVPQTEGAATVVDLIREVGSTDSIAVLSRVNSVLLPIQVLLTEANIACRMPLDESVLERTGMRAALAWLRIGMDPSNISKADLVETVRRPSRKIARNVVDMMSRTRSTSVTKLSGLANALSGRDVEKVQSYIADVRLVASLVERSSTAEVLDAIRHRIGLDDSLDVLDHSRKEADRSTHIDDLVALQQVAVLHESAHDFELWLRKVLRKAKSQKSGEADVDALQERSVELSTIHRVKGREWDNVIIYGCDNSLLPHRLATDVSEERRLFHVAITRASQRLWLVGDKANPTMFLEEIAGTAPRVSAQELRHQREAARASATSQTAKQSSSARGADIAADLDERGRKILDALTAWRKEIATRDKIPAYVVLNNADAAVIADAKPANLTELARCKGMGATRLERWGDEILSVIESV